MFFRVPGPPSRDSPFGMLLPISCRLLSRSEGVVPALDADQSRPEKNAADFARLRRAMPA